MNYTTKINFELQSNNKYLFSKENGKKEKGGVYEDHLFLKLEFIQNFEDGYIAKGIKTREAFGISCSF